MEGERCCSVFAQATVLTGHCLCAACQTLSVEEACRLARENAKDIIACGAHAVTGCTTSAGGADACAPAGFDRKRTFIFSDFQFMGGEFYKNCVRISKVRTLQALPFLSPGA